MLVGRRRFTPNIARILHLHLFVKCFPDVDLRLRLKLHVRVFVKLAPGLHFTIGSVAFCMKSFSMLKLAAALKAKPSTYWYEGTD